jgi:hypothetical protein
MTSSSRPVWMRFLGAHYPNFIKLAERGLAHVRSNLGEPAWQVPMADTSYVDPFPSVLQPPDDHPFANVIAIHQRSSQSSRVEPPAAVSNTHSRCAGTAPEAANATGFPSGSAT